MRAYLVDDEALTLERLSRMLRATGRVEIAGANTDPVQAVEEIRRIAPDVLFLDIHMPGLSGFELLAALPKQPLVIITTAYDRHALEAFRVNSIDYLLKPIEPDLLEQAISKAERMCTLDKRTSGIEELLARISASLNVKNQWLERIASRTGEKVEPIDLQRVTHFFSKDKLTYAVTPDRTYVVDMTIAELEQKLNPTKFVRINRGIVLGLNHLRELRSLFGGRMVARLKDAKNTELPVSHDRLAALKQRLGL